MAIDKITASGLGDGQVDTADLAGGAVTEPKTNFDASTDALKLPQGTTAQEPTAADYTGAIRFDSDEGVVTFSDGTSWKKINSQYAKIDSITGTIYEGAVGSDLTIAGSGFSSTITVNFTQASDGINENVNVSATSASATVTVPANVYNNVTAGNVVTIKVTNADGFVSNAVNNTAVGLPSGGTITTSGDYRIHTFTSSGTFTNTLSTSTEYLLVAGGGGGGTDADVGGGGGGGGLLQGTYSITPQSYSIVVGNGGAGGTNNYQPNSGLGGNGSQGGSSTAFGLTAIGGGYGGTRGQAGGNGGSGGGGGDFNGAGGAGTAGQGNAGGGNITGNANSGHDQGGGGGAGGAGNQWVAGAGVSSSITGTSVTYAAGGAGSGGTNAAGVQAPNNTGQGGRGSATTADSTGGSGIFVVRYDVTAI
jgi:hypothetical protein